VLLQPALNWGSGTIDHWRGSQEGSAVRRSVVKFAAAILLASASLFGMVAAPHVETAPSAQDAIAAASGAHVSAVPAHFVSGSLAGESSTASEPVVAASMDPLLIGTCAALVGCCLFGLAIWRFRSLVGRSSAALVPLAPRARSIVGSPMRSQARLRPSLTQLSISRT